MCERISWLEKTNELVPGLNEEIAVAEYKNNVLVEQENAILEILECGI